jgi:hypothetical protein
VIQLNSKDKGKTMGTEDFEKAKEGLQYILDNFKPESDLYKKAQALLDDLITWSIPF